MPRTVGTTPTSYPISVTITGGTAARGCTVRAINRRTGESASEISDTNSATLDLANLSKDTVLSNGKVQTTLSGFRNSDTIDINITGGSFGSATIVIDQASNPGGVSVSIDTTDTSSTNTPGATV